MSTLNKLKSLERGQEAALCPFFVTTKMLVFILLNSPKISQMQKLCSEPDSTEHTAR